jgi:DNA repair protein RadD
MSELRWYQQEAVDAVINCKDNGVVVLPTASGKSHVIRGVAELFPDGILILSHVQEILEQNFSKLAGLSNIGLYSAGLGVKHISRITVAGIQSVYKKPELFSHVKLVLIDEAHLVSDEGMYKELLTALGVPYIGLTATPFRLKGGYIYKGDGMFDSVCYEAPVKKLVEQGYLCPLKFIGDENPLETKGIKITGGDYNTKEMSLRFNRSEVTKRIVEKVVKYDRKHILVFCIDIEHAEEVAAEFNRHGLRSEAVHSKSPRDQALLDFKAGKIQVLTNVNILTTGFDYPALDMIVVLRPTKSLSLHQQMLGRGMRLFDQKTNTLVKDYTGNTASLGTMEDPSDPVIQGKGGKGGDNPFVKTCPDCELMCHPSVKVCSQCGHKFKFRHNLRLESHNKTQIPKWYDVDKVLYSIHRKPGSPESLKVSYMCGVRVFNEWVLLDHTGFAAHKAYHWVSRRWPGGTPPTDTNGVYRQRGQLKTPKRIQVEEKGKYPKILSVVGLS